MCRGAVSAKQCRCNTSIVNPQSQVWTPQPCLEPSTWNLAPDTSHLSLDIAKGGADDSSRNVRHDPDLADSLRHHPVNSPADGLFVARQQLENLCRREVLYGRKGPHAAHQSGDSLALVAPEQPQSLPEARYAEQSPPDRLAVQEPTIGGGLLERVAKRVSQVQDSPQPRLALVATHNVHLHFDRLQQDRLEGFRVARAKRVKPRLELEKESGAVKDGVLYNFVQPGAKSAVAERGEHNRVRQHQARRVESAHQVLHRSHVDGGLPAHRAVDLRDHGSRRLHAVDAPHVGGRNKAAQITDHAAPEGDEQGVTVRAALEKLGGDTFYRLQGFRRLAGRHKYAPGSLEAALPKEFLAPAVPQRLLGQHEDPRIARHRKPSQCAPSAAADYRVISRFVSGD